MNGHEESSPIHNGHLDTGNDSGHSAESGVIIEKSLNEVLDDIPLGMTKSGHSPRNHVI